MRNFKNKLVKKMAALVLAVGGIGFAASPSLAQDAPFAQTPAPNYQPRTAEDLQQLAGPVALYPDALLAQVFVAATYPQDVVAAAQYLQNGGDPNQVGGYNWDTSVKGLLQAPDALNQLANNVDWMNQLGDAFLNQQQDVMNAVQALRQQAQANGNLNSTPEQQVVAADNCIQIVPANPQLIYVPVYDPAIVYVRRIGFPCITFRPAVRVGLWLGEDFDWCDHRIYTGSWGFERPWWHRDVRGFDYVHSHPGAYVNVNVRMHSSTWVREAYKARPVVTHVVRPNYRAPEIATHGPRANGIGLGGRTKVQTGGRVTSHTTTNVRTTGTTHTVTPARVTTRTVTTSHVTRQVASSNRPAAGHTNLRHK